MLIIQHQQTGKQRTAPDSDIEDVCLILAAINPEQPTDKERNRAKMYKNYIMHEGRTVQAAGVHVWYAKAPTSKLLEQAEELFGG